MSKIFKCGIYARHLGDYWSRINYMLRLVSEVEQQYDEIHFLTPTKKPYMYETGSTINSLLDYPFKDKLSIKQVSDGEFKLDLYVASGHHCAAAYFCDFYETKKNWGNTKSVENKVCVSYDSGWQVEQKTPLYLDSLHEVLQEDFEVVKLNHPMTIDEYVSHLSECKCFFTVDAGLSQMARSIKCPTIIAEHRHRVETAHPRKNHTSWAFYDKLPKGVQQMHGWEYELAHTAIEAYSKISNHVYGKEIFLDQIRSVIKKAKYIHSSR
jgi:hypothetical protein